MPNQKTKKNKKAQKKPSKKRAKKKVRARKRARENTLRWVAEPLFEIEDLFEKPMFGCLACYGWGRLLLVLADKDEPWSGILIPTHREFHSSLTSEFPFLTSHKILGKWLYLSQSNEEFEELSSQIIERICQSDTRFGVEPSEKKPKK